MTRTAIYARVSSDRQEREETVQSQLVALRAFAHDQGDASPQEYVDEGISGATLERPALGQLRDAVRSGSIDAILLYAPDRLARKVIYQAILMEEFERAHVKVGFLHGPSDDSDESQLLLTMQGAIAEYERAKISERTRRGKHHRARQGAVIGGFVPYGYRYVPRDGDRRSTLAIDEEQAAVVREMFRLLIEEHRSCRQITRVLVERGVPSPSAHGSWRASTVNRIVKQEAYVGRFWYARHAREEPGPPAAAIGPGRHRPTRRTLRPRDAWIPIAVPRIIDDATWERAQRQLVENFQFSPRNNRRHAYLLAGGLVRCLRCGAAMSGGVSHGRRLYRCTAADPLNVGERGACRPRTPWAPADQLETTVWEAVVEALGDPALLRAEYGRRVAAAGAAGEDGGRREVERRLASLRHQEDRLLDLFQIGEFDEGELLARVRQVRARREMVEAEQRSFEDQDGRRRRFEAIMQSLDRFTAQVRGGLDSLDFTGRQQLVRLVVRRVTISEDRREVQVVLGLAPSAIEDDGHGRGPTQESARLRPTGRHARIQRDRLGTGPGHRLHQHGARADPTRRHRHPPLLEPAQGGPGVNTLGSSPFAQLHHAP